MFGETWTETSDQSAGQWETGTNVGPSRASRSTGNAHVTAVAVGFGVIALKAVTDSNLIPGQPSLFGINIINALSIWFLYKLTNSAMLWATDAMDRKGVALPGQVAFVKGT